MRYYVKSQDNARYYLSVQGIWKGKLRKRYFFFKSDIAAQKAFSKLMRFRNVKQIYFNEIKKGVRYE